MKGRLFRLGLPTLLAFLLAVSVQAQGTRSTLSGVVTDTGGGVLPGVTVVVTSEQTGTKLTTVTNERGVFSVPALDAGNYAAILTLSGFKTVAIPSITIVAGSAANVDVKMDIGGMEETVTVSAISDIVQTQATTVSTVMPADTLKNMPFVTRNLMDSMTLMVGVDSTSAAGDSRDARVNGLPGQSVALTMDGVSIKSAQGESDFYAYVFPTIDSVEQVTITGATQGADSGGGSASVRFVTRSGTSRYSGSFFDYFRHTAFNTNYYFNKINDLPKNRMIVSQVGGTFGGPIIKGRDKAFFFVSWEELVQPISETNTRTILSPQAQAGLFRYDVGGGVIQSVDLYALAARNGQLGAPNAVTAGLLATIRNTTNDIGLIRDTANPNTQQFIFQDPGLTNYQHLPAMRLDYNINAANKLTGSYRRTHLDRAIGTDNRTNFPGLPGGARYNSLRTVGSITLRTIMTPNVVSELVGGWQNQTTARGRGTSLGSFDIQGGYVLGLPLGATAVGGFNGQSERRAPLRTIDQKTTWQKGLHSWSFGASWQRIADDIWAFQRVPSLTFGVETGVDPADAMFTTANFPGASTAVLNNARALYGYLTGRVTGINGNVALEDGRYQYLGKTYDQHHLDEYAFFVQDRWRMTPTVTLNYGLRYGIQLAGVPDAENYTMGTLDDLCGVSGVGSDSYGLGRSCNIGKPGTLTGSIPTYDLFTADTKQWQADTNNLAPNFGVAWRPNVQEGWLRGLLGDPEQATVRGSFSVNFNSEGTDRFRNIYSANPGRNQTANRSQANGNLVLPGESWPLLLSQPNRLGPPAVCPSGTVSAACYPETLRTPFNATSANPVAVFDQNLHSWYSRQFTVGVQRALSSDTAIELRYVGTRSYDQPSAENWNEPTLVANGFVDEFKLAQANLYANIAAGRGQTFAYTGAPGTSPLPIFLASYNGARAATDPAAYTGTNWTSSTNTALLRRLNQNPAGFVTGNSGLFGSAALRANGVRARLPVNFWVLNPDVSNATFLTNTTNTVYNSMQIELRRRYSQGLQFTASYSRSFQRLTELDTITREREWTYDPNHSPHAFKFLAAYEIPVGQGRAIGGNMGGFLNAVIGHWNVSATSTVQSGEGVRLSGVKLVGMTEADLQDAFKVRIEKQGSVTTVYSLPQDIIDNTIKAFSSDVNGYTNGAPTGRYIAPASDTSCVAVYRGDCGTSRWINVRGPISSRLDLSFKKQIPMGGNRRVDLQYDFLNVFDAVNFIPVLQASADQNINQITAGTTSPSQVFDPGGRLGQLVVRFVW